ncbi:MAG: hypothetical protein FWG89_00535 [Treponema sp.]|nr:hypothetical protein [Treponema sp.]
MDIDFINLTNDEYKKINKNLLWYPVKRFFYWKGLMIFLMIMATIAGVMSGIGFLEHLSDPRYFEGSDLTFLLHIFIFIASFGFSPIVGSVLAGIIMTVVFFLAGIMFYLFIYFVFFAPFMKLGRINRHRKFRAQFNLLDATQKEMLLREYPERKIVDTMKHTGNKDMDTPPGSIYLTENFIFVAGLFLMFRENINDVQLRIAKNLSAAVVDYYTKGQNGKKGKRYSLPLILLHYSPKHAPHALEEIMAWYWQCDSDDPDLRKRMDSIITWFDTSS